MTNAPDEAANRRDDIRESNLAASPFQTPRDLRALLGRVQERFVLGTAALYSSGYAAIGLILLLASVAAEAIASRRLPWRRSALDGYLLAFVAVVIVSGLFSPYQSVATGSALLAALTIYVTYGLSYRIFARESPFTRRLLWFWYAGGVAAAAVAIVLYAVDRGPQATLPALGPNALGSTLLMALVIGMGLLPTARPRLRYAIGAGELVIALALAFTLSRGAWIGGGCGLLTLLILSWRRSGRQSGRRVWPVLLAVAVALTLAFALLGGQTAVLRKKALSITNLFKNRERLYLARSALAIAADHPLVGSGLNTFVLIHPHPSLRGDPLAFKRRARVQSFAHNIFLNMAAEGGLLGLVAFIALLIRGAAAGWRWQVAASERDRATSVTVLAAFVGLLVHQQFDGTMLSVHLSVGLWLLLAIMIAHEPALVRGPASAEDRA